MRAPLRPIERAGPPDRRIATPLRRFDFENTPFTDPSSRGGVRWRSEGLFGMWRQSIADHVRTMDPSSKARAAIAGGLMTLLVGAITIAASRTSWHAATSVDGRTYVEMIRGVSEHGLP